MLDIGNEAKTVYVYLTTKYFLRCIRCRKKPWSISSVYVAIESVLLSIGVI